MKTKTEQMKIKIQNNSKQQKAKYYAAFSFLFIRPVLKSALMQYFDFDIERAFFADSSDLSQICDFYNISFPKDYLNKRDKLNIEECYEQAFCDPDVKLLTVEDELYPAFLREIPDFPISLYYKGDLSNIDHNFNLAIVGSRKASNEAKNALNSIICGFENSNINIISGLAYGIDTQAHLSAIKNNLKTIAVVGSGLDIVYPSSNKELFENIVNEHGAVLSEYPLKTPPRAQNFPQRNRIVVGMSKGTLVAEAQVRSGAMISANLTLDYNRELMCIPGNILNPNTSGIYHLIKNGAGIVCCASDLLNLTGWDIILEDKEDFSFDLTQIQKSALDLISIEAKTFDEIALELKEDITSLIVALTELELKSLIKQINNKYYKI